MQKNQSVQKLTAAAMLIAVGVVIPMFMPIKVVIEPASFTLASHVAIFLAMFISPGVSAAVAAGTTLGFLMGGFPIVVVLRAASQIVFAIAGSLYLKRHPATLASASKSVFFSFAVALLHGASELVVVSAFYFGGNMTAAYYDQGFLTTVLLLVGLGTVVHSMVDFAIAQVVLQPLLRQKNLRQLFASAAPLEFAAHIAN